MHRLSLIPYYREARRKARRDLKRAIFFMEVMASGKAGGELWQTAAESLGIPQRVLDIAYDALAHLELPKIYHQEPTNYWRIEYAETAARLREELAEFEKEWALEEPEGETLPLPF